MPFVLSDTNILEKKITEKNIYDCVNLVLTSVVKPMDYGLWIFALFQLFHTQKTYFCTVQFSCNEGSVLLLSRLVRVLQRENMAIC